MQFSVTTWCFSGNLTGNVTGNLTDTLVTEQSMYKSDCISGQIMIQMQVLPTEDAGQILASSGAVCSTIISTLLLLVRSNNS